MEWRFQQHLSLACVSLLCETPVTIIQSLSDFALLPSASWMLRSWPFKSSSRPRQSCVLRLRRWEPVCPPGSRSWRRSCMTWSLAWRRRRSGLPRCRLREKRCSRTSQSVKPSGIQNPNSWLYKWFNACMWCFVVYLGPGAAAWWGGGCQAEASDGKGHHRCQTEEDGGGRHGAGRPELQTQQGLKEMINTKLIFQTLK